MAALEVGPEDPNLVAEKQSNSSIAPTSRPKELAEDFKDAAHWSGVFEASILGIGRCGRGPLWIPVDHVSVLSLHAPCFSDLFRSLLDAPGHSTSKIPLWVGVPSKSMLNIACSVPLTFRRLTSDKPVFYATEKPSPYPCPMVLVR